MDINVFYLDRLSPAEKVKLLKRSETDIEGFIETVMPVVKDVRDRGDAALVEYCRKFDKVELTQGDIAVTEAEFEAAEANLSPEIKEVIQISAENVRRFHQAQMPKEMWFTEIREGVMAGEKTSPIDSVGLYVPRGKGSFPSVMIMLCIPAVIAGVPDIIVCTPPTPDAGVDDASLFTAKICGINRVFKAGGAQAVAAMAYGTAVIPKVGKVIGPGNAYVSAAKRLLYGVIDVGTPAGPSEAIILCDEGADPVIAALDLLIEAEHGPDSTALLVTHDRSLANDVKALLPELIAELPPMRQEFCLKVLSHYGGIVITNDMDESLRFVNEFAPEHLEVLVNRPLDILPAIKNAGEILLGEYTPITIGNFSLGVNAILPTGGFAATSSCVTVHDFLKRSSIGYLTRAGYLSLAETARKFAEYEGFAAHAQAISKRPI